jgi:hypothetical protein
MQVNPKWRLAPEHGGVFVYDDAHRLYVMNNDVRACQDITGVVDGMGVKMDESREMLNRFRRYIVRHQGLVHAFEGDKPEDGVVFTPRDGGGYSVAPLGYFLEQRKKPAE